MAVNEKMSGIQANGAAMLHTMQRHKEILKDYKLEFTKTQNNFTSRKDREDLLGNVRKEIEYAFRFFFFTLRTCEIPTLTAPVEINI